MRGKLCLEALNCVLGPKAVGAFVYCVLRLCMGRPAVSVFVFCVLRIVYWLASCECVRVLCIVYCVLCIRILRIAFAYSRIAYCVCVLHFGPVVCIVYCVLRLHIVHRDCVCDPVYCVLRLRIVFWARDVGCVLRFAFAYCVLCP